MFDLDIQVFRFIYESCETIGRCFNFGAFEGLLIFTGSITLAVITGLNMSKRRSK
ncbi:MAG: hypothetical protein ACRC7R_07350 [Sarcina sp.]